MKTFFAALTTGIFIFINCVHAQQKTAVTEYALASKRTLIVELLQENPKTIEKLQKQSKKNPEDLENYQKYIANYNAAVQDIMTKNWKLNEKIEFKTTEELMKIWKSRNASYMLLYLHMYNKDVSRTVAAQAQMEMPVLEYQRADRPGKSLQGVMVPIVFMDQDKPDVYATLLFAVTFLQQNINYNKENTKRLTPTAFAEQQAEKYCDQLSTKPLLIDQKLFSDKTSGQELKSSYKFESEVTTQKEIDDKFKNGEQGNFIMVAIPYDVASGSSGPLSVSRILFFRAVVDPTDGRVISIIGRQAFQRNNDEFNTGDLENFGKCK